MEYYVQSYWMIIITCSIIRNSWYLYFMIYRNDIFILYNNAIRNAIWVTCINSYTKLSLRYIDRNISETRIWKDNTFIVINITCCVDQRVGFPGQPFSIACNRSHRNTLVNNAISIAPHVFGVRLFLGMCDPFHWPLANTVYQFPIRYFHIHEFNKNKQSILWNYTQEILCRQ